MAINNFKPFSIGSGANVISQTDYEALASLISGFQSGKASSAQVNKALRQATVMASVLAQYISDTAAVDVLDDGDTDKLLADFKTGVISQATGRLIGTPKVFTSSGTYTPTPGTRNILVHVLGGGGGTPATGSSNASAGGGGGAGGLAVGYFTSGFSGAVITIGAGGVGQSAASGSSGGATSFGSLLSASGGLPGAVGGLNSPPYFYSNGRGGVFTGSYLYAKAGVQGSVGQTFNSITALGGNGGGGEHGAGGSTVGATSANTYSLGIKATGNGSGGGGAVAASGSPATTGGS